MINRAKLHSAFTKKGTSKCRLCGTKGGIYGAHIYGWLCHNCWDLKRKEIRLYEYQKYLGLNLKESIARYERIDKR